MESKGQKVFVLHLNKISFRQISVCGGNSDIITWTLRSSDPRAERDGSKSDMFQSEGNERLSQNGCRSASERRPLSWSVAPAPPLSWTGRFPPSSVVDSSVLLSKVTSGSGSGGKSQTTNETILILFELICLIFLTDDDV